MLSRTVVAAMAALVLVQVPANAASIFGDPADFERNGSGGVEDQAASSVVVGKDSGGSTTGAAGANAIFVFDISSLGEAPVAAGATANFYFIERNGTSNIEPGDLWFVGFSDAPSTVPTTADFLAGPTDPDDTSAGFADGVEKLASSFVTTALAAGQYLSADITSLLNARPSGTAGDAIWFRINPAGGSITGSNNFEFATADATGTSTDPFISIPTDAEVVPTPAAGAATGLMLTLLGLRRRR